MNLKHWEEMHYVNTNRRKAALVVWMSKNPRPEVKLGRRGQFLAMKGLT